MRTPTVLAAIGSTLLLSLTLAGCEDGRHGYSSNRNYSHDDGSYSSNGSRGCYDRSGEWHSSCGQMQSSSSDNCYDSNGNWNRHCDRHDHSRDNDHQNNSWLERLFRG